MQKCLNRIVALLLIPCLLAEPVCSAGAGFLTARPMFNPVSVQSLVTTQALAEIALAVRERCPILRVSPILGGLFKALMITDPKGVSQAPTVNFLGMGTVFSL